MSKLAKALTAAAGNAGGESLYVEDVFSTYLYEGTNTSTAHQIQNGIDLSGEGGLVWIKKRDSNIANTNHHFVDTERGDYYLASSSTNPQAAGSDINAFNSDGWTFNASTGLGTDYLGSNYASWTFRKAEKFFDVVTYTGDGDPNRTVAHNLGSVPACIIVKRLNSTGDWAVYHQGTSANPEQNYLWLNSTDSVRSSIGYWNDTAPTDTEFSVRTNFQVNSSGSTYVAYLFASDAGGFGDDGSESIIKCGSFTTAGGTEVNLGFEPQWVMIKRTDSTGDWEMLDTMRGFTADASAGQFLEANNSNAEFNDYGAYLTSTGFVGSNQSASTGASYIYIAIRRPMKTPESGTEVFDIDTSNSTGNAPPQFSSNFPVDMAIRVNFSESDTYRYRETRSRLVPSRLKLNTTDAEAGSNPSFFAYMDGCYDNNTVNTSHYSWMFKRATGFFDVVAYTGDSVSGRTVTHNLKVIPELIICKARAASWDWVVYTAPTGGGYYLKLNDTQSSAASSGVFPSAPTDSVFSLGSGSFVNSASAGPYIAYLFATLAGVSKVGSYTGTGSNVDVDCGFSAGARFILIKRTDSSGDWYVWDSVRGIVAGNDPYLLLNSSAAEVTSTDYIDPLSSGFTVTSSAPAALNASGGNYIFLAIA